VEVGLTGSGNYWTRYGWRQVGTSGNYDYIVSSSFTTGDTVLTGSIDVKDNVEYNKLSEFTESLDQGISGPIDITIRDFADGVLKNTTILTNQTDFSSFNNTFPENTSTYTAVTRSIQIEEQSGATFIVAAINVISDSDPCSQDPARSGQGTGTMYVTESWDGFTIDNGELVVDNENGVFPSTVQSFDLSDANVTLSPFSITPLATQFDPGPAGSFLVLNSSLKLDNQDLIKITTPSSSPFVTAERCPTGPEEGGDEELGVGGDSGIQ